MGFRSVMITEDIKSIEIPQWFLDKYPNITGVTTEKGMFSPLLTKGEQKFYQSFADYDLFLDIQKIYIDRDRDYHINIVLLHECGGITKIEIHKDKIVGMEPTAWKRVEGVEHDYCYGCSDYKNIEKNHDN